jgi:hypothetical protein
VLELLLGFLLAFPQPVAIPVDAARSLSVDQSLLSGRLGGDAQLEGGCEWLDPVGDVADEEPQRFKPLWPEGYYVTFDPVRLWDPDGRLVAEEGDDMTVAGRVRSDIFTICQVGTPYEVERILTVNGRFIQPE